MKELGVGAPMLLGIIPFFIAIFKPSWMVKYFVILGFYLLFFSIGALLNDEGARKEFPREWNSLLLFPVVFLFWWLVSKFSGRKKKRWCGY